jgi:hypothetical protein
MIRGQLAGRFSERLKSTPLYSVAGILEVKKGKLATEVVHPFTCFSDEHPDGFVMMPPAKPPGDYPYDAVDIGSLITQSFWTVPVLNIEGGSIFTRRTRMPAADGCEILMFAGVLKLKGRPLDETVIHELGPSSRVDSELELLGVTAFDVVSRRPCPDLEKMKGNSFNELLKLPIWGFGDEPAGFRSTMSLDVIDQCIEMEELRIAGETTLSSERMAFLDAGIAGEIIGTRAVRKDDAQFQLYQQILDEWGCEQPRMDAVVTTSELTSIRAQAKRAIEEMFLREGRSAPGM